MFGFSLVSLYSYYLRRIFRSSGLYPQTIQIDPQTTIHCWLPTKSGFPSKPPLVLIHGFGPSAIWQWRSQVQSLSRHFSLYVPDLVFFGGSSTSSPERSEVFQAASVAKMLEKLGVEQFSVVGTSYGGFVAYNLGRICGEKVEKVVIASSGVSRRRRDNVELLEKAGAEKISDLMLPSTAKDLRTLLRLSVNRRLHIPDCLLNDVIHTLYKENREEKMQLLTGLTIGKEDDVQISPLQQEVLIIWGEFDQIFPLEKAFELRKWDPALYVAWP
ncbi:uncharacterized protein LOC131227315 isoform X2 [Magnolia sinica]|uniref:uncharacterized protein LOC131227315 isoform X2 n=1 Tax=Magnolia sinica TaxID=86752 RepID=UPI002659E9A9|nr:uncharacterized protein LOC131227315 isoform X2 [Magnolia sinica]